MFGGAPLASFFSGVFNYILLAVQILIIFDIACSWAGNSEKPFPKAVKDLAERLYSPLRKVTKMIPSGGFDLAPIMALVLVVAIQQGLAAAMFAYLKSTMGIGQ
jgi:uncharacterized protein YggT (Ycf19 family)